MKKEGTKQVLSLDQETAIRLYKTAAPDLKELLEANFGMKVLSPKIEDRILTFDDVIDELENQVKAFRLILEGFRRINYIFS